MHTKFLFRKIEKLYIANTRCDWDRPLKQTWISYMHKQTTVHDVISAIAAKFHLGKDPNKMKGVGCTAGEYTLLSIYRNIMW